MATRFERTEEILRKAELEKPKWLRIFDKTVYWVVLLVAIVGNFIISVVLVPFMLILKGVYLYASLLFIGISFGWLFSFILSMLEKFEQKHIIAAILIPALALINVAIFAVLSNKLIVLMKLATPEHNPLIVGAVYVLGYVLPYALANIVRPRKRSEPVLS